MNGNTGTGDESSWSTDAGSWSTIGLALGVGAVGVAGVMYKRMFGSPAPVIPPVPLDEQSVEYSAEERDRVYPLLKDNVLSEGLYDDVNTLYEGFRRGLRVSGDGPCLGHRVKKPDGSEPYEWMSYSQVLKSAENVAIGMLAKGILPGQQSNIGIYSVNRPEWVIVDQACMIFNMVSVPLYDTLGPEACRFIIKQADIRMMFCDTVKKVDGLLDSLSHFPSLKYFVCMEPIKDAAVNEKATRLGAEIINYADLEAIGKGTDPKPVHVPPSPYDVATISYTSGTTGTPKGVLITHRNLVAGTTVIRTFAMVQPNPDDIMISYLPLAHGFERMMHAALYQLGCRMGFYRGNVRQLTEDIKELRPTFLPVVPRLLNRIYDKVMQEVNKSSVKKFLFEQAIKAKQAELDNQIIRNNSIWDHLVFKRVREGLGGRVRLMCTGSAPLAENVLTFFRAATGCIVLEGYGQTETAAIATVSVVGDASCGHVGAPIPCCRIKVCDVPEMNYFAKDGSGEVCIKGHNVFIGYYKEPEKTTEAMDEAGWLHTGDIGRWLPGGQLKLIDRKKHIFKLSQGEYIAPEKIENIYCNSKYVAQVFVYGESLRSSLIGIIVPDHEVLLPWARNEGIEGNISDLCRNQAVKKLILDDITAEGKKAGLFSFEQVKDIHLHDDPFSIQNGLLTPTFKSKRPQLTQFFKEQLAEMYQGQD